MLSKQNDNGALFLIAYLFGMIDAILFNLSTFANMEHVDIIVGSMRIAAVLLTCLKVLLDRQYTLAELVGMVGAGALLLIAYLRSGYNHLIYLLLALLGMRNVSSARIIRFDFVVRVLLMCVVIFSSLTGITENYVTWRTGSTTLRYSLGYNHPNTLASMCLVLMLEEAWLHQRKFSIGHAVLIWSAAAILYRITSNRTAILLMAVFPVLLIAYSHARHRNKHKTSRGIYQLLFLIMVALSFLMMQSEHPLMKGLDALLSNRFSNAKRIYDQYGISLLGQHVVLTSVKTARMMHTSIALLDIAYLRMLIQAGPLVVALVAMLYFRLMKFTCLMSDGYTLLIVVLLMIFGLCESTFNNVYMNFTLVLACQVLYETDLNAAVRDEDEKRC